MKKINSFVAMLKLLKVAVQKSLLLHNVHILSDITLQCHTCTTVLGLYERLTENYQRSYSFVVAIEIENPKP